jgi:hypothetical protein
MPQPTASTIQVLNIYAVNRMGIDMHNRCKNKIRNESHLFYPIHPKYKGLVLAIPKINPRKGVYNKRISDILPEYNFIAGDVYLYIDEDRTDSGYDTFILCEDIYDILEDKQKNADETTKQKEQDFYKYIGDINIINNKAEQKEKDFYENIQNVIY